MLYQACEAASIYEAPAEPLAEPLQGLDPELAPFSAECWSHHSQRQDSPATGFPPAAQQLPISFSYSGGAAPGASAFEPPRDGLYSTAGGGGFSGLEAPFHAINAGTPFQAMIGMRDVAATHYAGRAGQEASQKVPRAPYSGSTWPFSALVAGQGPPHRPHTRAAGLPLQAWRSILRLSRVLGLVFSGLGLVTTCQRLLHSQATVGAGALFPVHAARVLLSLGSGPFLLSWPVALRVMADIFCTACPVGCPAAFRTISKVLKPSILQGLQQSNHMKSENAAWKCLIWEGFHLVEALGGIPPLLPMLRVALSAGLCASAAANTGAAGAS